MRFLSSTLFALLMVSACHSSDPGDAHPDASCDPACHWDCFGGAPTCHDGIVSFYGFGPRPCCGPGSGVYTEGVSACVSRSSSCTSGSCGAVDARYGACLATQGPLTSGPFDDATVYFALLCSHSVPIGIGSPCASDADCRPAPVGVDALACDSSGPSPVCALVARPAAPAEYGLDCGLASEVLANLPVGEGTTYGQTCTSCQVFSDGAGCAAQRCTIGCSFDEDCPSGSVCLCSPYAIEGQHGYCAPATDRTTPAGRFGDPVCP